jgi:hypothetical protein
MVTDPEKQMKNEFKSNFILSVTISVHQWLTRSSACLEVLVLISVH